MRVRDSICLCGADRRVWSPICGALIAAIALEAQVAHAEAPPAPTAEPSPTETATPPGQSPRAPLVPVPPIPTPPAAVTPPAREDPIRLDASAVLSLNDLFRDPVSWHAPFPSYEASIRTLQFDHPVAPESDRIEKPLGASAFSSSPEATWFDEHIELSFDDGVTYRHNFHWRGMNLRLKVWGPVLKGNPGLGVRLRGLQLAGHEIEVRARSTTDLQDIQFQISF